MKTEKNIYLDNHSTTQCDPQVIDIINNILLNTNIGNPHSTEHSFGWEAEQIIKDSSEVVSDFLNSLPTEIYFTSGATESNNIAILGTIKNSIKKTKKRKIIVSEIEHKCVIESSIEASRLYGFNVQFLPTIASGIINIEKLEKMIDKDTLLVSIMHTNNEIGTIQPINEIGKICKDKGAIFHVDASQGFYSNIDVIENNIDLLSMSGHKFYAPVGVGILFVNETLSIKPLSVYMGGSQQMGMRSGTISVALIAGFCEALKILISNKNDEINHLLLQKNIFIEQLKNNSIKYKINGSITNRHPGNLNIQLIGQDAKELLLKLQPKVALSTGSACNTGFIEDSYVLKSIGLIKKEIDQSIRIGFGRFNNYNEIRMAVKLISQAMD